MTIWREIEGWTFEYFDRDIEPAALPGYEDFVRLWQGKRGDRAVPSWSDFDFYDFKGWHGRLSVYDISYDPFDYTCRLSGTEVDVTFDRTMTGVTGSELAEMRIEHPATMEFYEMTCRQMLISRQSGPLNFEGRGHVQVIFVELPLSDDGLRATHIRSFDRPCGGLVPRPNGRCLARGRPVPCYSPVFERCSSDRPGSTWGIPVWIKPFPGSGRSLA